MFFGFAKQGTAQLNIANPTRALSYPRCKACRDREVADHTKWARSWIQHCKATELVRDATLVRPIACLEEPQALFVALVSPTVRLKGILDTTTTPFPHVANNMFSHCSILLGWLHDDIFTIKPEISLCRAWRATRQHQPGPLPLCGSVAIVGTAQ